MQSQSLHGNFDFRMAFIANGAGWTLNSTESILKIAFCRQDCEHPKNTQFDIYAITSNFFNKFQ